MGSSGPTPSSTHRRPERHRRDARGVSDAPGRPGFTPADTGGRRPPGRDTASVTVGLPIGIRFDELLDEGDEAESEDGPRLRSVAGSGGSLDRAKAIVHTLP